MKPLILISAGGAVSIVGAASHVTLGRVTAKHTALTSGHDNAIVGSRDTYYQRRLAGDSAYSVIGEEYERLKTGDGEWDLEWFEHQYTCRVHQINRTTLIFS